MDPTDLLLRPCRSQKRSLIRRLSRWLPLPKASRIHFQKELLQSIQPSHVSYCRENSDFLPKNLWYTPAPVSLADVFWLIRDDGEEGIFLRCQLYGSEPLTASTPVSFHGKPLKSSFKCCAHGQGVLDAPTQTPISSLSYGSSFTNSAYRNSRDMTTPVSSCVTTDEAALERIRQLENDLMIMRQQLAAITLKQEQLNGTTAIAPLNEAGHPPSGVQPAPSAPPPPPPPPPPAVATPQMSLQEIIKNNKSKTSRKNLNMTKNQPDMAEILKGISSVKLRSIKRSPGGTPIREKPLAADSNDPIAIISKALKKKFAACHLDSPEKDSSPSASGFSPSPRANSTPPGPHLLRSRLKHQPQNTPQ